MFLHTGNGRSLRKKNIIGIFDLDTATVSGITRGYINANQSKGNVEYYDTDLPRSFVVYERGGAPKIRLSRISAQGLKNRAEGKEDESETV
jgi:hypothetical protein